MSAGWMSSFFQKRRTLWDFKKEAKKTGLAPTSTESPLSGLAVCGKGVGRASRASASASVAVDASVSIITSLPPSPPRHNPTTMEKSTLWLKKYEQILLKNSSQISSIESGLRSLSFILPGRFKDVEVASESIYSILQILGMYHDSIISKAAKREDPNLKSSPHNRYTEYQSKHNGLYRTISLVVQLTRYTELLWEMISRRHLGEKGRWYCILILEAWKSLLRLLLVAKTKRPLTNPLIPEREVDPEKIKEVNEQYAWKMPRMGQGLEATPMGVEEYLNSKTLTAEDVKSPIDLLHKLPTKATISEIAYILRPLVYAALAYKYRQRPRNWTPWVVGVGLEYFARNQLMESYHESIPGGFRGITKLESEEIQKRGMNMWWWLLRGSMYESVTRPVIQSMLRSTRWIPGVGLVGSVVDDYLYLLDNYHFSSSSL